MAQSLVYTFFFCVPQGWILGPVLFNTFLNDQHSGAECILSVFADDTKLARVADMPEGPAAVQSNLSWMETWDDKNLMKSKKGHRGD